MLFSPSYAYDIALMGNRSGFALADYRREDQRCASIVCDSRLPVCGTPSVPGDDVFFGQHVHHLAAIFGRATLERK